MEEESSRSKADGVEGAREEGLEYYRARCYSAGVGRFLQRDPLGLSAGANLYEYVRSSPINWSDPTGTDILEDVGGFFGDLGNEAKRCWRICKVGWKLLPLIYRNQANIPPQPDKCMCKITCGWSVPTGVRVKIPFVNADLSSKFIGHRAVWHEFFGKCKGGSPTASCERSCEAERAKQEAKAKAQRSGGARKPGKEIQIPDIVIIPESLRGKKVPTSRISFPKSEKHQTLDVPFIGGSIECTAVTECV
ncbi:MAG: RHS repeat-associated core domain-containing protein [Planctomycetota bacterium]|nr:RHS repeat-associated core domain-containing protein [Planctomycetota bacterium]